MKMSKSDLKAVVKECLLEILQEGLASSLPVQRNFLSQQQSKNVFAEKTKSSNVEQMSKAPSNALRNAIKAEAGGNKIMEAILADTAASTLPKMLQNEGRKQPMPTGTVEQIVASTNPEEIFGSEISSKWADLAFMDSIKK